MNCPRCKTSLIRSKLTERLYQIEVDKCPECQGIWFEKGELNKISQVIEPRIIEFRKIPNKEIQVEPIHCPSCFSGVQLLKAEHPRDEHVIVDYCSECKGIWLDKGELEAIQQESWLQTIGRISRWLFGADDFK